ncbi:hypothetical protein BH11PAT2_BH11PAT2_10070 [soil metagenome]
MNIIIIEVSETRGEQVLFRMRKALPISPFPELFFSAPVKAPQVMKEGRPDFIDIKCGACHWSDSEVREGQFEVQGTVDIDDDWPTIEWLKASFRAIGWRIDD